MIKQITTLLGLSLFALNANAAPINIVDTPQETTGGFRHNVFHVSTTSNLTSGAILGWFEMNNGGGYWDPTTGDFSLSIDIFSDSNLTNIIGTAQGTGTMAAAEFNGFDGGYIGSIIWDFDADAENNGLADTKISFLDENYATSNAGYTANSLDGRAHRNPDRQGQYSSMTLWGANGFDHNRGFYSNTTLGMDLVVTFQPVPVPAAVWLFGSGLIALTGFMRKRKSA